MHPVVIFSYLRYDLLEQTLESLTNCADFEGRKVFVFQDGLKLNADAASTEAHANTRNVIDKHKTQYWTVVSREKNLGLAKSVHTGVTEVLKMHEAAIILEDDLLLAPDFLAFMDDCLEKFQLRRDVYSISGFCHLPAFVSDQPGVFLFPRPGSWGWATWADRWMGFELGKIQSADFENKVQLKKFDRGGEDMSWMLRNSFTGKVNSWAIQWAWYQFQHQAYSVYPDQSKVKNIGFDELATHTVKSDNDINSRGEIALAPLIVTGNEKADEVKILRYSKYYRLGLVTRLKKALRLGMF
jgi:hypothetical protein